MLARFALTLFLVLPTVSAAQSECSETRVDLRGDWGSARFTVELADTHEERALGLMNRESMPKSSGMLFVYEYPQTVAFWMENTLIPLDMIFMDAGGVVRKVHEKAVPRDRTLIPGGDDILAVLEINGGMSSAMGIGIGTQLRHPALDPTIAAWPCDPVTRALESGVESLPGSSEPDVAEGTSVTGDQDAPQGGN